MVDLRVRQFLEMIAADPAAGLRHFAPTFPKISVRDFINSSSGSVVPPWTAASPLANAVYAAGFIYDPSQSIIYSRTDPLQRRFGYAYGYDVAAIGMNAILDCEPIFFDYAGKHWMIELWKGQYGLETGCEIGIYNRAIGSSSPAYDLLDKTVGVRAGDPTQSHNLFFDCASDSELLVMSSTLSKSGQLLFRRGPQLHWWLTGFKWGVYSRPEELSMQVAITCRDGDMSKALLAALTDMGYPADVSSNTVSFNFATPSSHQPRSDLPASVLQGVESADQGIVDTYNGVNLSDSDPNHIGDELIATVMNSVAMYSSEFFGKTVAGRSFATGVSATELITGLIQVFGIGIADATQWAREVGYGL
jgi:hypothetical protein